MLKFKKHFVRHPVPSTWEPLRQLVAAGAVLGVCLPASCPAAELAPVPPAGLQAFTWTGLYLGGNIGASFTPPDPRLITIGLPSPAFDLLPDSGSLRAGATGGVQGGYNYETGPFVMGVETDFNYLGSCRSGTFAASEA